jgi:hypothetical protein
VLEEELRPADELGAVATPAGNPAVRSLQKIPGLSVVERLLTLLTPPDELKLPPVMLDMTALAGGVALAGVETASGGDSARQKAMAAETEGGIHSLPRLMTLEALSGSIQLGVRFAQLAGRDLSQQSLSDEKEHQRGYCLDRNGRKSDGQRGSLSAIEIAHRNGAHP